MNHSQIAHVWANNPETDKRGSRIFCDDGVIYSYGRHFPMACHIQNKKGVPAFLVTTRTYSVSTAKHLGYVQWAIHGHGKPVFYIENVPTNPASFDARKAFEALKPQIAAKMAEAKRPRIRETTREAHLTSARGLATHANSFAEFFGIRARINVEKLEALAGQIARQNARTEKGAREARAERKRLAAIREQERQERERVADERARLTLAAWINHEESAIEYPRGDLRRLAPALRVKAAYAEAGQDDGDTVETSHGAEVPIEHVRKAVRFVALVRFRGQSWNRNGHTVRVGHFQLDEVTPEGNVRAGCHHFKWEEIERFALSQGWEDSLRISPADALGIERAALESTGH